MSKARTDTGSEIALVSAGRRLTCGWNHLKPYDSSEDKCVTSKYHFPGKCCLGSTYIGCRDVSPPRFKAASVGWGTLFWCSPVANHVCLQAQGAKLCSNHGNNIRTPFYYWLEMKMIAERATAEAPPPRAQPPVSCCLFIRQESQACFITGVAICQRVRTMHHALDFSGSLDSSESDCRQSRHPRCVLNY